MGLLKLAHTKSVPGADDFLPVFIYVLIMANPPYLLSTIQVMVQSFTIKELMNSVSLILVFKVDK